MLNNYFKLFDVFIDDNFFVIKGRVYLVLFVFVRKSSVIMYMNLVFDCKYINVYVYYYFFILMMIKIMLL